MLIEFAGKQTASVIGTHKLTPVQVSCDISVTGMLQDSQVILMTFLASLWCNCIQVTCLLLKTNADWVCWQTDIDHHQDIQLWKLASLLCD